MLKKLYNEKYYKLNRSKILKQKQVYYSFNKKEISGQHSIYRKKNKTKISLLYKAWRKRNKLKLSTYMKEYGNYYYRKNKKKIYERIKLYKKFKRKTDPQFKIKEALRTRFYFMVKSNYKSISVLKLLGCSVAFLKQHLESQFKQEMSWSNYGVKGWHIDHIKPCASFDLSNPEEQKKCFHYTNLQPLWALENLKKGKKENLT